jgi:ribosomal protein L16 Arg81 hydroxylase
MRFEELLSPLTEERFLAEHYRTKELHVPGGLHRVRPEGALGWPIANRILSLHSHMAPGTLEVGITRERTREMPVIQHKRSEVRFQFNDTLVAAAVSSHYFAPEAIAEALREGFAVIVNDAQALDGELLELCQAVEDFTKGRAWCNLYVTSQKERYCPPHVDAHDSFILHLCGTKIWRLHAFQDAKIERNINPAQHPDFDAGDVVSEIEVNPGDVLYVPWGRAHSVVTQSPSLHLAVGFKPPMQDHVLGGRLPRHQFDLPAGLED